NVARHPTQLYEAFSYLALFFVMWYLFWKTKRRQQTGFLFGLFLVVLWPLRFVIEFFKGPQVQQRGKEWFFSPLNTGQVLSIPLILIGFWLMLRKSKKEV
ncbi:MAG: prolipoprotein diacylglyceryl transferase family protein, partial [Polaribacter sp.]